MAASIIPTSAVQKQQNAARLSIYSNIFLVVIKVGAGLQSNSLSVLGEGVQSLLDIVVSALIWFTVRAAAAPPDEAHPWGHGKFENLTSLFQMLLVLASIGGIWWAAWLRFHNPQMPVVDWGIAAILVSIAINIAMSRHMSRVARATDSSALAAEAVHLRGDLWACAGVLLGLVSTHVFRDAHLDPLCAAIMTLFAAYAAIHLLRDTLRPLLDETLPGAEESCIRQVLNSDARVFRFSQAAHAPGGRQTSGRRSYHVGRQPEFSRGARGQRRSRGSDSRGAPQHRCHRAFRAIRRRNSASTHRARQLNCAHETQMDARRKMVVGDAFNFRRRRGRGGLGAGRRATWFGTTNCFERYAQFKNSDALYRACGRRINFGGVQCFFQRFQI